ncbi:MAG: helix-turn-helix protein [Gammaproteobacteria bacterium]|jgi:putative transcriptional regulator|nr:helix-turn-helix protein [Gammaproteobacteria bacterium]
MSRVGKNLLKGAEEAVAYAKDNQKGAKCTIVRIPKHVDVREIREELHMTREVFAAVFGFNMRTLEKWEQGVRNPEGPTRAYLQVIKRDPLAVQRALSSRKSA